MNIFINFPLSDSICTNYSGTDRKQWLIVVGHRYEINELGIDTHSFFILV